MARRFALTLIAALALVAAIRVARHWSASPSHPRVLLVGIDGADPVILDRLVAAGRLPTFARLRREGAFGTLRSREPLLSPLVWTTIVTGRAPEDHGILDFVEADDQGRAVPITSARRRVPALWNIATQYGHSSGFIGWYASFPVEPVNGFEVSDRVGFHQVANQAVDAAAFPPALADQLRSDRPVPIDLEALRSRFTARGAAQLTVDASHRLDTLGRMHATTEAYRGLTIRLQRTYRPELLGVYFEWIDACSHLFMEDAAPRRAAVSDADYRTFSETVDRCYEYQDEVLASVLTVADSNTIVIVCSDHGFKSGDRRPDTPGRADVGQAALWHAAFGTVMLRGASVTRGAQVRDASVLDIAPTILRALDVPLSRELPGRVIDSAASGPPADRATRSAERYAFVPVPRATDTSAGSADRVAELKALGYVSGSSAARPAADGRFAASFINEGVALYVGGDQRDALRAFARAAELDPDNVNARAFAARVRLERREFDQARALLDEALALDPHSAYVRLLRANLAIGTEDWNGAAVELSAAESLDRHLPMLYVQKARLLNATGRPDAVLEALSSAETLADIEPLRLDILLLRADAARRLGQSGQAQTALTQAAAIASPDEITAARADIALARNDAATAVAVIREALDRHPTSAPLWTLLGGAYGRSGAFDHAIEAYERSIALQPTALACKTLALLIFERSHDRDRALRLWSQSLELDRNQPDVQEFVRRFGDISSR